MASSAAAHMDGWSWMTAAFRAVLPVAHARFHEVADQAGARGNPDVFGLIREPTGSASEQAINRLALVAFVDTRRLQHYLGHASITNTVRYTAMSPEPFAIYLLRSLLRQTSCWVSAITGGTGPKITGPQHF
jgi:hypothetical protein